MIPLKLSRTAFISLNDFHFSNNNLEQQTQKMSQPYHQERRQSFGRLAWTPEETQLLHQLVEAHGPNYRLFIQLHRWDRIDRIQE